MSIFSNFCSCLAIVRYCFSTAETKMSNAGKIPAGNSQIVDQSVYATIPPRGNSRRKYVARCSISSGSTKILIRPSRTTPTTHGPHFAKIHASPSKERGPSFSILFTAHFVTKRQARRIVGLRVAKRVLRMIAFGTGALGSSVKGDGRVLPG